MKWPEYNFVIEQNSHWFMGPLNLSVSIAFSTFSVMIASVGHLSTDF